MLVVSCYFIANKLVGSGISTRCAICLVVLKSYKSHIIQCENSCELPSLIRIRIGSHTNQVHSLVSILNPSVSIFPPFGHFYHPDYG